MDRSMEQILEHTSAVVFAKDASGRYLFVNREFERLAGTPAAELVGRTDREIFPPEVAERFRRNDHRVLTEARTIEFEESVESEGRLRTYLSVKFPLSEPGARPYAVCGIATDITGRKRTEEALRRAALAVSGATGASLFAELVRDLSVILQVEVAFIATFIGEDRTRLRTRGLSVDYRIAADVEYPLAGSPCANVVGREFRLFPEGVRGLFGDDGMLRELAVEGYAAYPLTDSGGLALGLIGVMSRRALRDAGLTEAMLKIFAVRAGAEIERARAEEQLRRSEASYRAIFEASEDAIFIHDWTSGAILDVNPKACTVYGYTREEMLRLSVADLSSGVHPYTIEEAGKLIARAQAEGPVRFEWHRRNKDGSLHWDEVTLKPASIAGERRMLAVTREITARKLAEQALKASEDRLRATVEAALDCIVVMDAAGTVIEFNPAAESAFGHARKDVLGRPMAELLIPQRLRDAHRDGVARYLETGKGPFLNRRVEVTAMRADGSEFPAELAIRAAEGPEGRIFVGYLRDLTEQKAADAARVALEAQLTQAQKMEAIGHLAGGIAHDFNNILTSILGNVSLAMEREAALGDPRQMKFLEQARHSSLRARDLIQQLLTFARGQRGTPRVVQLALLVPDAVQMLRSTLPATLELSIEVDPAAPAALLDPVQVEQVLLNLCINARDAAGGSGLVRIGVRRAVAQGAVCASCRKPVSGVFVELAVSDDGPGIAPDIAARMFEPFYTTKDTGRGSGMGLAIVHGIVHDGGGHVVVDAGAGQGTTFRLLFPALAGAAPGEAGKVRADGRSPRPQLAGRVLVVDDEAPVAEFMRELLSGWGLEVALAATGAEALDAVARAPERFDAVVTDHTMPKMTGLELARRIAALRPAPPVILCTGYADALDEAELKACGVRALVHKPFEPDALLDALRACLDSPRREG
jgi:PAS domain S-box-containing protein